MVGLEGVGITGKIRKVKSEVPYALVTLPSEHDKSRHRSSHINKTIKTVWK